MNRTIMATWLFLAGALVAAQTMPPAMMGHSAASAGGGGVTVGQAVSGGTASRLLHTDASGNVATAATALGAGLELSGALDVKGSVSNSGSASCSAGGAGYFCVSDNLGVNGTLNVNVNFNVNGNISSTALGAVTFSDYVGGNYGTGTTLSADANDFALATNGIYGYRLSGGAADRNITGMTPIVGPGSRIVSVPFCNVGTTNSLVFKNEDAASTAANRIITPGGTDYTLPFGACTWFHYDGGSSRWRIQK